ncbi:MAG: RluA family pseudouridine synthase [Rhodobacteraceae bacterium]|jgi:23S rRNA pseudouridine955/2504/2580 synthase|nr:RluA family pseudouridine synthase [Paracoccaceae bacterium]
MSGVQHLVVGAAEGDQRLDRWLRRRFPGLTQGRVEKLIRTGQVRLDGARAEAGTRIAAGQQVRVPPLPPAPPAGSPPAATPAAAPEAADAAMIQRAVLFRDADIIVLNKPHGLASQGGSGLGDRHLDALTAALTFGYKERPVLVHRLDRDTSGLMVLARTPRAARRLAEAFRSRETRKIYWALVAGVPSPAMGTIRYGLVKAGGHGPAGEGERMRCVLPDRVEATPGARHATTDYAVLATLGRRAAWVALVPVTGRTHQLRAHMAETGHPIVGDGKYGGSGQENAGDGWGASLGPEFGRRLHLHARHLWLTHPVTGARLSFTAPLPPHMAASWATLGWQAGDVPPDPFPERR